jgi:hypothetical protein
MPRILKHAEAGDHPLDPGSTRTSLDDMRLVKDHTPKVLNIVRSRPQQGIEALGSGNDQFLPTERFELGRLGIPAHQTMHSNCSRNMSFEGLSRLGSERHIRRHVAGDSR